jgi:hypothetical protein
LLVFTHAGGGTEPHVPVALNTKTEFAAEMIAAQSRGSAQNIIWEYEGMRAHRSPSERLAGSIADL